MWNYRPMWLYDRFFILTSCGITNMECRARMSQLGMSRSNRSRILSAQESSQNDTTQMSPLRVGAGIAVCAPAPIVPTNQHHITRDVLVITAAAGAEAEDNQKLIAHGKTAKVQLELRVQSPHVQRVNLLHVSGSKSLMDHSRYAHLVILSSIVSPESGKWEKLDIHISSDYPLSLMPRRPRHFFFLSMHHRHARIGSAIFRSSCSISFPVLKIARFY